MTIRTENLTILFVDIAGFTATTSRQSRAQNAQLLQSFNSTLQPLIRSFKGTLVKSIGDALLLTFRSPTDAMLCAMALQDAMHEHNLSVTDDDKIHIRVAANLGEVRISNKDIFGEPVNVASRIEGIAPADEIWLSDAVYMAMNKAEVPAQEVGLRELAGVAHPVRIYCIPRFANPRLVPEPPAPAERGSELMYPYGGMHHRAPPSAFPARQRNVAALIAVVGLAAAAGFLVLMPKSEEATPVGAPVVATDTAPAAANTATPVEAKTPAASQPAPAPVSEPAPSAVAAKPATAAAVTAETAPVTTPTVSTKPVSEPVSKPAVTELKQPVSKPIETVTTPTASPTAKPAPTKTVAVDTPKKPAAKPAPVKTESKSVAAKAPAPDSTQPAPVTVTAPEPVVAAAPAKTGVVVGGDWSLIKAKQAYRDDKLSKAEYRDIIEKLENDYEAQVRALKLAYKAQSISKREYAERVNELKRAYKGERE